MISEDPRRQDNWIAYSEAICNEYTDPHEAATAFEQVRQLKYKGDVKAYITVFKTLNRVAGSNGEGLQHIINKALPHDIIDVRFYQNPRPLTTDQDFLTATYEAGRHVEALKALKSQMSSAPAPKQKEDQKQSGKAAKSQGEKAREGPKQAGGNPTGKVTWGGTNEWSSSQAAIAAVPPGELATHRGRKGCCHRCGQEGHRGNTCYARKTMAGTLLPPAPWIASAVSQPRTKRARDDDGEEAAPAPKQLKASAAEVMDLEAPPIWAEDSSEGEQDFH
jgi:hypothetical protein